jgi:hypothetical protein
MNTAHATYLNSKGVPQIVDMSPIKSIIHASDQFRHDTMTLGIKRDLLQITLVDQNGFVIAEWEKGEML